MSDTSDLTEADGAVVISIEVARHRRAASGRACQHVRVTADAELSQLHCRDCKREVSAVQWIIRLADNWDRTEAHRRACDIFAAHGTLPEPSHDPVFGDTGRLLMHIAHGRFGLGVYEIDCGDPECPSSEAFAGGRDGG